MVPPSPSPLDDLVVRDCQRDRGLSGSPEIVCEAFSRELHWCRPCVEKIAELDVYLIIREGAGSRCVARTGDNPSTR